MSTDVTVNVSNIAPVIDHVHPGQSCQSSTHNSKETQQPNTKGITDNETKAYPNESSTPNKGGHDTSEANNDLSALSSSGTAFTISFDDNNSDSKSNKKLFGIRDSIRKFAPPKPNTIEKPRPSKSENQENSYMSIESAPGGYGKHSQQSTFRRDLPSNHSCCSSGRRSDSSRHSNISESAAFLINKMLNNGKQGESISSIYLNSDNKARGNHATPFSGQTVTLASDGHQRESGSLEDELDYCGDRSDNGTYIIDADPETDAARKRIDELFGAVKAAEASLVADSIKQKNRVPLAISNTRPSRAADKKSPLQAGRKDHVTRPAANRQSSRSSSSSRQELSSSISGGGRHPRSKVSTAQRPQRRAASQTSRRSSNRDLSEPDDTRSSRSSLHNQDDMLLASQSAQTSNPNMKFNRAFALRRARLGLGEPIRAGIPQPATADTDGPSSSANSPRRVPGTFSKYDQTSASNGPKGTAQNLSRTDGGRFSLRMRNNVASRLTSGLRSGQAHHQATSTLDNLSCKAPASKHNMKSITSTTNCVPYPSGDELDVSRNWKNRSGAVSSSRAATLGTTSSSARVSAQRSWQPSRDIGPEWELIDSDNRLNYSLGLDQSEAAYGEPRYLRQCQSAGRRTNDAPRSVGLQQQQAPLGALDCLVISAISSLSTKIRSSVCDLMIDHAKRLPGENETRLIVEEILPQLVANTTRSKSPTSIEDIDQSVYFDLAQTLKNLKKLEQMVDVIKMISSQLANSSSNSTADNNNIEMGISKSSSTSLSGGGVAGEGSTSTSGKNRVADANSESTSLSPI